ncbi:hypothetical protein BDA99DRAFT_517247 [Phascolomyces articulosus]|uniref:Uncharacterized protein n=1 Tax=Phascolomyces articulosus TaxID=60185 RepID=A0AAD5K4U5_9FUNG|nr:hypothetical protein BDA99DRAFT_517247 [Phascolomyces articulosus]
MEDIDTSGSLSFRPTESSSIQPTPPRQYNEEDLDVCPNPRASHLIELVASRQRRKRISHLLKASTLSGFSINKK